MPPELHANIKGLESRLAEEPANVDALVSLARLYMEASYRKGVEPSSAYRDFAREAEPLLRKAVTYEPTNALAWNIYLSSYYRMCGSTLGHGWHSGFPVSEEQRALIETAFEHCPTDPGVALWYELINESQWELPRTLAKLSGPGRIWISVHYGYAEREFSDSEMLVIKSYYDVSDSETGRRRGASWLVRNGVVRNR